MNKALRKLNVLNSYIITNLINKILFLSNKIIFNKISRNNNKEYRNFLNIGFPNNEFNRLIFD